MEVSKIELLLWNLEIPIEIKIAQESLKDLQDKPPNYFVFFFYVYIEKKRFLFPACIIYRFI